MCWKSIIKPLQTELIQLGYGVRRTLREDHLTLDPLHDVLHMLLRDSLRLAGGSKPAWGPSAALGSRKAFQGTSEALHGRDHPAGRHWDLQIFG